MIFPYLKYFKLLLQPIDESFQLFIFFLKMIDFCIFCIDKSFHVIIRIQRYFRARIVNVTAMNLLHSGDVSTASKATIEVLTLGSWMVVLVELRRPFPTSNIGCMATIMVVLVEITHAAESILEMGTVDQRP